jgi:long-chain acyl-CoA synthetase
VSDVFLSILPCWHIFERAAEYWCLARGSQMIYSNLRNFKSDLMVSF